MNKVQTEVATRALYRAIRTKLVAEASIFTDQVYARFHPSIDKPDEQIFPYVVMVFVGGGDADWTRNKDAELNIQIVCYADDSIDSEAGALVIDNALDAMGTQETDATNRLEGVSWIITSVTAGRVISGQEFYKGSKTIFSDGKVYRVTMEL